ncbi:MAG: hypothetical protein CR982_06525 [Candidatus Cloacimonadota bacterium]|nr:MAG: hypothetical protein CR982_06525 [Candidatus Cloacimonadota bacterium]PIE79944.1 MAG: hypothetical protein CSA15_02445 [Candidatus Delongbacteria bacterium]
MKIKSSYGVLLKKLLIVTVIFFIVTIVSAHIYLNRVVYTVTEERSITIPKGESISNLVKKIEDKGFSGSKFELKIWNKIYGGFKDVKYGKYILKKDESYSYSSLLKKFSTGESETYKVVIREGLKSDKVIKELSEKSKISVEKFKKYLNSKEFKDKFPEIKGYEGFLYPDTYNFPVEYNEKNIIDHLVKRSLKLIKRFDREIKNSNLSIYEIVTLASIIQGEVQYLPERFKVSAVYNNRLKKNMLLQADPTIQYLFEKPKRLLFKDLEIDSKYNTYKYKGLPPTPINNPSIIMIEAALKPMKVDFLYMVAKGDGTHYFNNNFEDHKRDKRELDLLRKKVYGN